MPIRRPLHKPAGQRTKRDRDRDHDARRRTTQPWRALYRTKQWQRLRMECLTAALFRCATPGCRNEANTADHIVPHKGEEKLFFEPANLQALCASCHSSEKQRDERGDGRWKRDADGWQVRREA